MSNKLPYMSTKIQTDPHKTPHRNNNWDTIHETVQTSHGEDSYHIENEHHVVEVYGRWLILTQKNKIWDAIIRG